MIEPVVKMIELSCTAEQAFEVFVVKTTDWWPKGKNSVSAGKGEVARDVIIEPRLGGAIYEITPDGARLEWGVMTRFEPGVALAMTWNPGGGAPADTMVEVAFEMTPNGCRVTLTHSGWEALGESGGGMRDSYNSGWVHVFEELYAGACQKS
jgi:hypothetical protein